MDRLDAMQVLLKVAHRIAVRILIYANQPPPDRLRRGMPVIARIRTGNH